MYVNYRIWLEVILWSWIPAEPGWRAASRGTAAPLDGESSIVLFSFIYLAAIRRPLAIYRFCKLCSGVFDVFLSTTCGPGSVFVGTKQSFGEQMMRRCTGAAGCEKPPAGLLSSQCLQLSNPPPPSVVPAICLLN